MFVFILREFEGECESFRRHHREGMLQEMNGARKGVASWAR